MLQPHAFRRVCLCLGFWLIALGAAVTLTQAAHAEINSLRRTAIVRAVESARPSVVNIHGRKRVTGSDGHFSVGDAGQHVNGMGTGIVIDERGYILTNYHVVEGVRRIQVTLADRQTVVGKLIAHDPRTDLAVIKIPATSEFPVIRIGQSSDLMPGEPVVAVGNAYGYEHTVTRGIISALHRTVQVSDEQKYYNLIQTDASINPGNSGGPLLNIEGDMIGINVAVRVGAQGIGFALPIDEAMQVAAELMANERDSQVEHGIEAKTIHESDRARVIIDTVSAGTPAEDAGLQSGDILLSIAGRSVERNLDIERAFLQRRAGEELELVVERAGEQKTLSLIAGRGNSLLGGTSQLAWQQLGLKLSPVPANVIRQLTTQYEGGLKITEVRTGSPAAEQGLRRGDILVGLHKWRTASMDNMAYILESDEFHSNQPAKFYILRGRETFYGFLSAR